MTHAAALTIASVLILLAVAAAVAAVHRMSKESS